MKNKIFLGIVLSVLISCTEDKTPIKVSKDNIQVTLPYFVKEDELAEDATIEYANRYRNFYITGFEFEKNINNDSLWKQTTRRITNNLDSFTLDTFHYVHHGLPSVKTEIKGKFKSEKDEIYYYSFLLFGAKKNYQMTVWTRGIDRKIKYQETIDDIYASFKENQ